MISCPLHDAFLYGKKKHQEECYDPRSFLRPQGLVTLVHRETWTLMLLMYVCVNVHCNYRRDRAKHLTQTTSVLFINFRPRLACGLPSFQDLNGICICWGNTLLEAFRLTCPSFLTWCLVVCLCSCYLCCGGMVPGTAMPKFKCLINHLFICECAPCRCQSRFGYYLHCPIILATSCYTH
jgi:hypothetical protein